MALPGIPQNFIIQQGNSQVLLSWNSQAGATSYKVYRSTDNITFTLLASPTTITYLDTTVVAGTLYYYYILSNNVSGDSQPTPTLNIVPVASGLMTLGQIRLQSQQRADRQNSLFVGMAEWNTYINQAAFELYDLLTTLYEDYYVTAPVSFVTTGATSQYNLTTIAPNFYKLVGVDLGISTNAQNPAWVTLRKFNFIDRNQYVYPQLTSSLLGVFNPRYRLVGSTLMFIPIPSAGQNVQLWYIPRMPQLLQDTDILDGVNGWDEYVIVRAAKYALDKEESDTSKLDQQIAFLKQRIEESAMNRDAGMPDSVSDVRSFSNLYGPYGAPWGDGGFGGY